MNYLRAHSRTNLSLCKRSSILEGACLKVYKTLQCNPAKYHFFQSVYVLRRGGGRS